MREALVVYSVGVLVGLWRTDGPLRSRIALALLWPLGPLAGALTIAGLMVAAVVTLVLRSR